jgi:hypothetical protein
MYTFYCSFDTKLSTFFVGVRAGIFREKILVNTVI